MGVSVFAYENTYIRTHIPPPIWEKPRFKIYKDIKEKYKDINDIKEASACGKRKIP